MSNLGTALRDLGKLDDAITYCRRALELSPDLAEVQNNLGFTLGDLGKLDEAIAGFRRAVWLTRTLPRHITTRAMRSGFRGIWVKRSSAIVVLWN